MIFKINDIVQRSREHQDGISWIHGSQQMMVQSLNPAGHMYLIPVYDNQNSGSTGPWDPTKFILISNDKIHKETNAPVFPIYDFKQLVSVIKNLPIEQLIELEAEFDIAYESKLLAKKE